MSEHPARSQRLPARSRTPLGRVVASDDRSAAGLLGTHATGIDALLRPVADRKVRLAGVGDPGLVAGGVVIAAGVTVARSLAAEVVVGAMHDALSRAGRIGVLARIHMRPCCVVAGLDINDDLGHVGAAGENRLRRRTAFGKVIIAVRLRLSGSISRDPGFDDDMTSHAPVACTTGGREYKPNATAGA